MGSTNKVVAVLVVWALVVTVWMVLLSTGSSWSRCSNSRDDIEAMGVSSDLDLELQVYNTHILHGSPEQTKRVQPIAVTSQPTSSTSSATPTISVFEKKLSSYYSRIMQKPPPLGVGSPRSREENCTMVLQTHYNMTEKLSKVISHYCKIQILRKILIIWNSVNRTIPFSILNWKNRCSSAKVEFVFPDTDKPVDGYSLWKQIETSCK
jgi:hypothetical protein